MTVSATILPKKKWYGIVDDGPDITKIALFYCATFFISLIGFVLVLLLEAYWPESSSEYFYIVGHPAGILLALSFFFLSSAILSIVALCVSWDKRAVVGYVAILGLLFTGAMQVSSFTVPPRDNPIPSFNYWFYDNYYDLADADGLYDEIVKDDAETVTVKPEDKDKEAQTFDVLWNSDHTGFKLIKAAE